MESGPLHTADHCLNCDTPLPEQALYCPKCGQKDRDTRISFFKLVKEALLAILNLDSRMLRTLRGLLVPGKLSQEFFIGRQQKYMNPVRLFLWVTLILIAMITWRAAREGIIKGNVNELTDGLKKSWELKKSLVLLDTAMLKTRERFPQRNLEPVFDSLHLFFVQGFPDQRDSIEMNANINFGIEQQDSLKVSITDLYELEPDSLINKYGITGFWNRIITKQKAKFLVDQTSLATYLIGKLTWAVFILMPLLALCLKLLYVRRDFYFVEHLIFAIHTHTLAFLSFIVVLLVLPLTGDGVAESLLGYMFLLVGIYVLLAQKRFYMQRWGKTIAKFIILQFFYIFLLTITMLITLLIGFFLF